MVGGRVRRGPPARAANDIASIFVPDAISGFLHVAYRGLKERA
jgi:hypothetical protein